MIRIRCRKPWAFDGGRSGRPFLEIQTNGGMAWLSIDKEAGATGRSRWVRCFFWRLYIFTTGRVWADIPPATGNSIIEQELEIFLFPSPTTISWWRFFAARAG